MTPQNPASPPGIAPHPAPRRLTIHDVAREAGTTQDHEAPRPSPGVGPSAGPPPVTYRGERWERVVLVPGVELFVRDAPGLRRFAQQIVDAFGSAPAPARESVLARDELG